MMEYDLFKSLITKRINEFLPPVFHTWEPRVTRVSKVNECKEAFCLMPDTKGENMAVPTVYLDDLYRDFMNDQDLDRILSIVASVIMNWSGRYAAKDLTLDFRKMRKSVVINLISAEMNQELLARLPHFHVMDLAVVFRIIMGINEEGMNSILMTHELMQQMEIEEDELFDLAVANSKNILPAQIIPTSDSFCILTNNIGINGASAMLYREEMKQLSDTLGGDFYIIPSSIHEIFAVPADRSRAPSLAQILKEGNRVITGREDLLSDSIYKYSRQQETLTRCCRTA